MICRATHLVAASGMATTEFADLVNRYVPKSASSRSVLRCLGSPVHSLISMRLNQYVRLILCRRGAGKPKGCREK